MPDALRTVASDDGEEPNGRSSETARFTRKQQFKLWRDARAEPSCHGS
jgi:hypothetical protein